MKSLLPRNGALVIMVTTVCFFASCFTFGNIEDRITKSFPVGSGGTLAIESDIGSIIVHGENIDSVEVEITREVRATSEEKANEILKNYDIRFEQTGNDVSIIALYNKRGLRRFWDNIGNIFGWNLSLRFRLNTMLI